MNTTLHRYIAIAITWLLLSIGAFAHAHEIRPALVDLDIAEDGSYQLVIRLNLEAILAKVGPEHSDTDDSPNASQYNQLRNLSSEKLAKAFDDYKDDFLQGLELNSNGERLVPIINKITIPPTGDIELARDSTIVLGGSLPAKASKLTWGWQRSFGPNALRVSINNKQDVYTAYLQPGKHSDDIALDTIATQSALQVFANYMVVGFEHIMPKGLDHILFVVGLFLLSLKLSSLLWQITSFTIAHSVTLAMGILGIINVSPMIVEPLIALSIVYVCIENILSDKLHSWRPVIIFSFGLLHGLGFASVLTEIGLSSTYFVSGLIAFNLGLELGQLSVIAICFFGIAIWFRHKPWYRQRITIPASAIIATIGAYWFVERLLQ